MKRYILQEQKLLSGLKQNRMSILPEPKTCLSLLFISTICGNNLRLSIVMIYLAKCRYPMDPYDRIWNADKSFTPLHVTTGFKIQSSLNQSNIAEEPPAAVLQSGRVLERRNVLAYTLLPLDGLGDYYIILYFAGILPVFSSFDIFINGDLVKSNYTIRSSEISALYVTRKGISSLNITLRIVSFYPQINAFEVYNMVDIPSETSSTTGASPTCLLSAEYALFSFPLTSILSFSFSIAGYSAVHWFGSRMAR